MHFDSFIMDENADLVICPITKSLTITIELAVPPIPSTPSKRKDSRPSQLIQYGKEKPNNDVKALFRRRQEQQKSISGFRG